MTPKEKAKELFDKFYLISELNGSCMMTKHTAKQCALICCDEVLGDMGADRGYEFWCYVRDIIKHGTHSELYITKTK